jgi:glycosyltransferase involved in cell wall biosynthesis
VIQDGHNGLLVEAGDVGGFAEAMLALLEDSGKRARLGKNARQLAMEQYSWKQYTRRLEEIYQSVTS